MHAVNNDNDNNNGFAKKLLYIGVATGAALSFGFWTPSTLAVIKNEGVPNAILKTYIPRLVLDAATITACLLALKSNKANKSNPNNDEVRKLVKDKPNKDKAKPEACVNPQKFGPIELRKENNLKNIVR